MKRIARFYWGAAPTPPPRAIRWSDSVVCFGGLFRWSDSVVCFGGLFRSPKFPDGGLGASPQKQYRQVQRITCTTMSMFENTYINSTNRPPRKSARRPVSKHQCKTIRGDEFNRIMSRFPECRVSYGRTYEPMGRPRPNGRSNGATDTSDTSDTSDTTDASVPSIAVVVPKGPKSFAWFCSDDQGNDQCIFVELDRRGNPMEAKIRPTVFNPHLCRGTVLYGTTVQSPAGQHSYFVAEDILRLTGESCAHIPYSDRLTLLIATMDRDLDQSVLSMNFVGFTLPCIFTKLSQAIYTFINSNLLAYTPYAIHVWTDRSTQMLGTVVGLDAVRRFPVQPLILPIRRSTETPSGTPSNRTTETPSSSRRPIRPTARHTDTVTTSRILDIRADQEQDTYHYTDPTTGAKQRLLVNSFVVSVHLNRLFRNIRENIDLDTLEMSDDEETFENTAPDKFVNTEIVKQIPCTYNRRFAAYEPTI